MTQRQKQPPRKQYAAILNHNHTDPSNTSSSFFTVIIYVWAYAANRSSFNRLEDATKLNPPKSSSLGRLRGQASLLGINLAEEPVLLHGRQVIGHHCSETLLGILAKKSGKEIFGIGAQEVRKHQLLLDNVVLDLGVILATERRVSSHQVVPKRSKGPPVDRFPVFLPEHNFRCHVLDGSQHRVASVGLINGHLGQAEVGQEKMAFSVQEAVLWLKIAVYYTEIVVQVRNSQKHFRHVESSYILGEHLLSVKMGEELAALSILKDKVQLLVVLESVEQLDNERVSVDGFENLSLSLGLLDELLVDHQGGFLELLLSIKPPSRTLLDQKHSAVCSLAEASQLFKVLRRHLTVRRKATFKGSKVSITLSNTLVGEIVLEVHFVTNRGV
ncbi:hypothetical protein HG531_002343 [Fusarium graminearum]|nr:hypothetical protein HG531_002343 [Fusarium graminearum]